ncbi:MAG: UDP-galactose-lipid carrier transferase [Blastochloris sp.]|nr:UDP-galactose-lipid carrier transferase [Blastochloris sp.]
MGLLDSLDLTKQIEEKSEYKEKLQKYQLELLMLQRKLLESRLNVMMVFEGPDAAGKGGVIKRFNEHLDPRHIRVYSTVKPTNEELRHHYLWRFWTKTPGQGEIAIFDRSWYGRVLVERVEGFATKTEWKRAYEEINQWEKTMVDNGTILLKFYLQITKEEQLIRFKKREEDPYKRWKINDEDWRNREKWALHNEAAEEMFEKTSPGHAPWHLVEGNFKWHARVKVLRQIAKTMTLALG